MANQTLFVLYLVIGLVACSACASGRPSEIVLAENTDWRIRATGGPYASGSYWWGPQNVLVDFVVDKRGEFYATGRLYDSGPGDYSFAAQFPDVEWVNANVIRLHRQPNKKVPFEIRLHNASTRLAKWILLSTQEVFLVLEPEAGDVISLTSLQWGPQSMAITGEWQDGTHIASEVTLPEWARSVEITVTLEETRSRVVLRP